MNVRLSQLITLTTACLVLTGCANVRVPHHTSSRAVQRCHTLKHELGTTHAHNINLPNQTPINYARLLRQYHKNNCDEVLKSAGTE